MKNGFKRLFKTTLLSMATVLCLSGCQKGASSEEFLEDNRIVETTETETEPQSTETELEIIGIDKESCTYAAVPGENGKYGIKNLNTGESIVEPKYDYIHHSSTFPYTYIKLDNKYGVINYVTGEEVLPTNYTMDTYILGNYITAQNIDGGYLVLDLVTGERFELETDDYYSLKVIDSQYAIIKQYVPTEWAPYLREGIINWRTNEVILEPYYDYVSHYVEEGRYIQVANRDDEFGIFDLNTRKEILPTIYEHVYIEGNEALGKFFSVPGKDRWINLETSEIILEKDSITWDGDYVNVKDGEKWYIVDRITKEMLFEEECGVLQVLDDTYAYIYADNKQGIINWTNNKVHLTDNSFILFANTTYATMKVKDKYGVINYSTGKTTTFFKYDYIESYYGTEYAQVRVGEKIGIINFCTGEEILSPIYAKRIELEGDTFAEVYLEGGGKKIINYHTGEVLFEINDDQQKDIIIFPQSDKAEL